MKEQKEVVAVEATEQPKKKRAPRKNPDKETIKQLQAENMKLKEQTEELQKMYQKARQDANEFAAELNRVQIETAKRMQFIMDTVATNARAVVLVGKELANVN